MADKFPHKKKYNKIIGIEISENNIYAVEIQFVKENVHITNAFNLNIPVFQDLNKTVSLIKQNLRYLNFKVKDVAVGLSMQYFKLFPVAMPLTIPQNEISSILLQEGNINQDEDFLSFLPLNNTKRQEPDGVTRFDVLGISLKRSILDTVKVIIKKSGLNLISVSPSFLNMGCFLNPQVSANLFCTLWISQIKSELTVWSGQEPVYEHLFLTHTLGEQLFTSLNQIQMSLQGTQIATIFTCGPFVKETNLSQVPFNSQAFSLPSNFLDGGNVFQRLTVPEVIVPLSIALSSSNNFPYSLPDLLHEVKTESKSFKNIFKTPLASKKEFKLPFNIGGKTLDPQLSKFIFTSIIILLLSLFLNVFVSSVLTPQIQGSASVYDGRLSFAQAHLTRVLSYEKLNKALNIKIDYFSGLIDKRKPWSKILKEVAEMTPKDLWIDRLELRNKNVDIFGRSLNVDAIANFSINLNYTAKLLGKSQIVALRKFQEEGFDIIEFQLNAEERELKNSKSKEKSVASTKSQKMAL